MNRRCELIPSSIPNPDPNPDPAGVGSNTILERKSRFKKTTANPTINKNHEHRAQCGCHNLRREALRPGGLSVSTQFGGNGERQLTTNRHFIGHSHVSFNAGFKPTGVGSNSILEWDPIASSTGIQYLRVAKSCRKTTVYNRNAPYRLQ
jgi:hypothetical protein